MKMSQLAFPLFCLATSCVSTVKKDSNGNSKTDPPKLLKPEVRKIWIPPEIRNGGTEWVEGHYLYRIEKETSWSR